MKKLNGQILIALIALGAVACGRASGEVRSDAPAVTITRSWPAADLRQLRVVEVDGAISVEAVPGSQILLVATARGDLERKPGVENDALFRTEVEGDTLRIGRKNGSRKSWNLPFIFSGRRNEIDYALRVPPEIALDIRTVNGRITSRGVEGATKVSTVNGRIDVESAGVQELRATTVNGKVRAKFLRSFEGARFKSVNGGVQAILPPDASFTVDVSQVNGDFEASFPLAIHSNPGSRRVSGEVNGGRHELRIVTVNGDVQLARLGDSL